ncbi:MAG: FtsK/SpoIIIE domain-containing protein [Bacteriovoracaceae bacterium]
MSSTKRSHSKNDSKVFDACINILGICGKIFKEAKKTKKWKKSENLTLLLSLIVLSTSLIVQDKHLNIAEWFDKDFFYPIALKISESIGIYNEIILSLTFWVFLFFLFIGIKPFSIRQKYQKGIDRLSFKSGLDEKPDIINVEYLNENRTKLMVKSFGIGLDRYKSKLDDLRASVGQLVESVKYDEKDNSLVEIYLAKKPLTKLIKFSDAEQYANKAYHFVIGKSLQGIITQDLTELPHLMIGGTSGGGKSHTLNNVLINLLKGSDNLEMHLIDLKNGLEIKAYEQLSNVSLIKNVQDASTVLKTLVDEMERRYQYLEKKGYKKLDPKRDKMNRIVVAIDECTDLLGKVDAKHPDKSFIEKSIQYVDSLARKARAAGIHLILATQKIDKSSIPTRIQENMQGRIALKVGTMENSVRMLGNRKAYDIPAVKGRAIWSFGSGYTEVQVPFITDQETELEIKNIKESIENKGRKNHSFSKATSEKILDTTTDENEDWGGNK